MLLKDSRGAFIASLRDPKTSKTYDACVLTGQLPHSLHPQLTALNLTSPHLILPSPHTGFPILGSAVAFGQGYSANKEDWNKFLMASKSAADDMSKVCSGLPTRCFTLNKRLHHLMHAGCASLPQPLVWCSCQPDLRLFLSPPFFCCSSLLASRQPINARLRKRLFLLSFWVCVCAACAACMCCVWCLWASAHRLESVHLRDLILPERTSFRIVSVHAGTCVQCCVPALAFANPLTACS